MSNTFLPKKSSVAGKSPLAGDLQVGELAINLADKKIYTKDASGNVVTLGGSTGTTAITPSVEYVSGNGGTTFTLVNSYTNEQYATVLVEGNPQFKNSYTIVGNTLTFTEAPPTGTNNIEVSGVVLTGTFVSDNVIKSFTGDGTTVNFALGFTPPSKNALDIFVGGLYQPKFTYSISGSTLTFTTAPPVPTGSNAGNPNIEVRSAVITNMGAPSDGTVTQAKLAANVAGNGPAFSAYPNAAQTIASGGVLQKVLFGAEEFDTNNNFANSRFTPSVAGYYKINSTLRLDGGGSGTAENMIVVFKNGTEAKRGTNSSGTELGANWFAMSVSALVYCNGTTDYIEIYAQQGASAGRTVTAVANITYFQGHLARAA